MRVRSWLLVGAVLSLASQRSASAQQSSVDPSVISASAQGQVMATPDRAHVMLSVETRASTASEAASSNAEKQTAVIAALKGLGISSSAIGTQNYTVTPETRNDKNDQAPHVVSYRVSNAIRVDVSDLSLVGKIIDAALAHGSNRVLGVDFYESNAEALYRKALASAVANARAEAETMAQAAGGHLGALLELNAGGFRPPTAMFRGMQLNAMAAETPIQPGQDTVQASVSGRWTFVPNG